MVKARIGSFVLAAAALLVAASGIPQLPPQFVKHVNRVPSRDARVTFLIHNATEVLRTPTYEACEELCIRNSTHCDLFVWMGNSPGFQTWRNRCTLRQSVTPEWHPEEVKLEFQFDTYTGVREYDPEVAIAAAALESAQKAKKKKALPVLVS